MGNTSTRYAPEVRERAVSIGVQSGPPIGVQKGPRCRCADWLMLGALRWSRPFGQFGGGVKLIPGCCSCRQ